MVRLLIVRDEDVDPTITVEVGGHHAQARALDGAQAGSLADVGEGDQTIRPDAVVAVEGVRTAASTLPACSSPHAIEPEAEMLGSK